MRTTNPSIGSPSHEPVSPVSSVKALTSGIVSKTIDLVVMKPHSEANASTIEGGRVLNSFVDSLRP